MFVELLIFVLILYLWWYFNDQRNRKGFPPGPPRYPLIGTLPTLLSKCTNIATLFENLKKKYGDIVFLSVGNFEAVVFNSYDLIMEILTHENAVDRGGSKIPLVNDRHKGKNLGIIWGSGKPWITLRHFTLRALRDFGFGKSQIMDFVINEEVEVFMEHIDKLVEQSEDDDKTILFHGKFELSVSNVVWRLVTGEKHKLDDPKMLRLMQMNYRISTGSSFFSDPSVWFPFLRDLFPRWFARSEISIALDEMAEFGRETIKERRARGTYLIEPIGFLDCLLQKNDESKNDPDSAFNDDQMLFAVLDLFQAGADTSSKTLEFAVLYMLLNPDVQMKVQREIDSVVPDDSRVHLSHKPELPYVYATLLETHRFTSLLPFNPIRTATEDFLFHGYLIKKGTALLANLQAHHHSDKVWSDPSSFRPERFLTPEGKIDTKMADSVLAFGAGKRVCVGRSLADATLFLYFTTLLRNYEFRRAPGKPEPTTEPTVAFMNNPRPFYARVVRRK